VSRTRSISLTVNGLPRHAVVEARTTLVDLLREQFRLTGTHVGCEHGVCGACTVLLDSEPVRGCLMLAVQAEGARVETVESLAPDPDHLNPLQAELVRHHGVQCGFCIGGILMSLAASLRQNPHPTEAETRDILAAHLCRCTGYQGMVDAVRALSQSRNPVDAHKPEEAGNRPGVHDQAGLRAGAGAHDPTGSHDQPGSSDPVSSCDPAGAKDLAGARDPVSSRDQAASRGPAEAPAAEPTS